MKKYLSLLLATAMIFSLAACGGGQGTTTAPEQPAVTTEAPKPTNPPVQTQTVTPETKYAERVTIAMTSAMTTIDPNSVYNGNHQQLFEQVFDTLVSYDQFNNTWEPLLAEEIGYTDDTFTKLHVKLRDDIYFSNGDKITTEDVQYSFDRGTYTVVTTYYDHSEIINDREMDIILKSPNAEWIKAIGICFGSIVNKKVTEADPNKVATIGSGPYVYDMDSYIVGSEITMKRNPQPRPWDKREYPTETIRFVVISDASARLIALEKGEIDISSSFNATELPGLKANKNLVVNEFPSTNFTFFAWNNHQGCDVSEDELNFRRAVVCAIDKEEIMFMVGDDNGKIMRSQWDVSSPYYIDDESMFPTDLSYNADKAKEYLSKTTKREFECLVDTSRPWCKTSAEVMQEQLKKVGITMKITETDSAGMTASTKWNLEIYTAECILSSNTYGGIPSGGWGFYNPGNVNKASVSDPVILDAIKTIMSSSNEEEVKNAYYTFQIQNHEQVYYIPLYWRVLNNAYDKNLGGFSYNSAGNFLFRGVYKIVP